MTQTGLISFPALTGSKSRDVHGALTSSISPPSDPAGTVLADFHRPAADPLAGVHRPEAETTKSFSPRPPPHSSSCSDSCRESSHLSPVFTLSSSLHEIVFKWKSQCIILTVCLLLCLCPLLFSFLVGDHRPEAEMH